MKVRLDYETVFSILVQFLNIVVPFLILKFNYDINGVSSVVAYEVALSLIAFFSILINFSSSTFLSTALITKIKPRSAYYTIVKCRFVFWLISFFILLTLSFFDSERLEVYILSSVVLFSIVFELQFYFISRSRSYIYQLLILPRTLIPLFFLFFGFDLLYSISFSYFISIILQLAVFIIKTDGCFSDSKRFRKAYMSRFRVNTFSELLSAVFSQLDTFIVSNFLTDTMSIIYITLKKLIRVVMSLLNYVFRSMYFCYVKFGYNSAEFKGKLLTSNLYIFLAYLAYFFFWDFLVFDLLSINEHLDEWSFSVFIFSFVIIFGYVKSLLVHLYLYPNKLFMQNMVFSLIVLLVYFSVFYVFDVDGDVYFTILNRVMVDFLYIVLCLLFMKLSLSKCVLVTLNRKIKKL